MVNFVKYSVIFKQNQLFKHLSSKNINQISKL